MLLAPEQARELRLAAADEDRPARRREEPALDERSEFRSTPSPLTIGRAGDERHRAPERQLRLAVHARFEHARDGVWVEDLGSTNGTYVNGVKLTRRAPEPGDIVRVGETDLRFER